MMWGLGIFVLFLYLTVTHIQWGLPYPFHPDERNMADAVVRMQCSVDTLLHAPSDCWNPEFYAYGQAPLFLAKIGIGMWHFVMGTHTAVTFTEAVTALRLQSVVWVFLTGILMFQLVRYVLRSYQPTFYEKVALCILCFFQPYMVQYAHFGTTEAVLMFLYTLLVCLIIWKKRFSHAVWPILVGIVVGIAVGIKISLLSSLLFVLYELYRSSKKNIKSTVYTMSIICIWAGTVAVCTSFQSLLHMKEFIGSMTYEIGVGNGSIPVFYTQQFKHTIPYLFHIMHVFPYTLGIGMCVLSFLGLCMSTVSDNKALHIIARASIIYFALSGGLYIKWARFMAPIMPLLTVLGSILLYRVYAFVRHHAVSRILVGTAGGICVVILMIPALAYAHIYMQEDVRFEASTWMMKHIPQDADVFLETGNVMDLPISDTLPHFHTHVIDMYDVADPTSQRAVTDTLAQSEYVVIASRRVFTNYACARPDSPNRSCQTEKDYPFTANFYKKLFSGTEFELMKTFSSYPQIRIAGRKILEFPDEYAEEAHTVFDHPVIRIYKRTTPTE